MEKKLIYFWMFIFVIFMLASCTESSTKTESKKTIEPKIEEVDTLKTEITDSLDGQTVEEIKIVEDIVEQPVKKVEKKDVFKIYKNGVRQNLVIAYNTSPHTASEDWVWFTDDLNTYFNETNPTENLLYYAWPPEGISDQDMAMLAKELGIEGEHAGYYLIGEGKKDYIQHNLVYLVLEDIYSFFEIEKPAEE